MKNVKLILITMVLCSPLSAWGDFEITDFSNVPTDVVVFADTVVGPGPFLTLRLKNTGTEPIEAITFEVKGDFSFFRIPSQLGVNTVADFEIEWCPTHPGKHVKNLTIDGWRANADGTIDALSITLRMEGRATK